VTAFEPGDERAFRTAIAHSFPGTLGAPIKAGQELPASAAAIKEALPDVVACVAELEKLTGPELSSKFFRASVHQWNSNPYEADGGTTGPELQASADDGAIDYVNVAEDRSKLRPGSRSFVNVTALAYLSGLRRIGAQRSGWRDVRTDINLSKKPDPRQRIDITPARIGALAGLLVRLQRAGAEHAASSIDLLRDGSVIRSAKIADFDLEFLKDWAQALRSPPSPGATPLGTDMNLEIVAGPAGHKDALIQFVSELAEKKFLVLAIGDQLTVKADPATPMSGDDCAQLIASAHDSLPNEATVAGGGTKDGKTNSKKLSKEAAAKLRPHWSIVLRPLFDAPGATRAEGASPLMMATGDALELPTPGIPRALEWWHYEHFDSADSTWKELVTGIGLSEEILLAPAVPKLQDAPHAFNTAGIGFSSKEVGEVKAGWFDKALPENQWQRPPEGG